MSEISGSVAAVHNDPIEVEQKFHLVDEDAFVQRMRDMGGVELRQEINEDHYFNHPAKDFGQTREALRVRMIDGRGFVTYKGPKLPGLIKARRELEWSLGDDDSDGAKMRSLLTVLDFRPVAVVRKTRRVFSIADHPKMTVVLDNVEGLGRFVEIETICGDGFEVEAARNRVFELAQRLQLDRPETRSYLSMLLQATAV
jgi:adenylate cyclase, class 2